MIGTEDSQKALRAHALALLLTVRDEMASVHSLSAASADAALRTQCDRAGAALAGVEAQLSQALAAPTFPLSPAELMMLTRTVQASNAASLAAQGQGAAASAAQTLAAADTATRATAEQFKGDLFTRHIFDPYLQFSSQEDKDDYRAREAERQRYVAAQLARKTPEGNLNAAGAEEGQMLDAHAHGAGKSPEFMPHWNRLVQDTERLRAAMRAAGQSTEEFDRRLRDDIHAALQCQGVPAAQIEQVLASGDPLRAVTPYLGSDSTHALEAALEGHQAPQPRSAGGSGGNKPEAGTAPISSGLAAVQVSTDFAIPDPSAPPSNGHGLPAQARVPAARTAGRTGP